MAASMAQNLVEAYVLAYTECAEHLPDEVQRQISIIRELDVSNQNCFRHIDHYLVELLSLLSKKSNKVGLALERSQKLVVLENVLIETLEDYEEKLKAKIQIQLKINSYLERLDHNYAAFESRAQDQENIEPNEVGLGQQKAGESTSSEETPEKKTKRKCRRRPRLRLQCRKSKRQRKEPPRPKVVVMEKHCLCDRVAFGNMIQCDNVLCPRKWFHFECVGLTGTCKKRGKWYCPICRGDRFNVMKPNVECLKEPSGEFKKRK